MNGEETVITVLIVAASAIVRAGLESVLHGDESIVIAGSAAEISAALPVLSVGQTTDVLLINVEGKKDFETLIEFVSDAESNENNFPSVVALFSNELQTAAHLLNALQNNLRGILPHDASAEELSAAIKAAALDLTVLSPEFTELILSSRETGILDSIGEKQFDEESVEKLTAREDQVLELLVEGESNKRIANLLNISEHTVKFHVASIFGKLGATTRTEAVTVALRRGLILL